jgi:hypothetical protein
MFEAPYQTGPLTSNGSAASHSLERGLSPEEVARRLLGGKKPKRGAKGWRTLCPAHDDRDPSLDIDHGKNGGLVACCRVGCSQPAVIAALKQRGIDLGPPRETRAKRAKPDNSGSITALQRKGWQITREYDYQDEAGQLLYRNVRLELLEHGRRLDKTFRQRKPRQRGDGWTESIGDTRRVPYRLPELVASGDQQVHIPEGEKDADRLRSLGLVATSIANPRKVDLEVFRGRSVVIHEDNDQAGRKKASELREALADVAASVVVVRYDDAGDKADVSDWLDQSPEHDLEALLKRVEMAEVASEEAPDVGSTEHPKGAIEWPDGSPGKPRHKSQANILAFLDWACVTLRHNAFTLRDEITRDGETSELSDASLRALFLELHALGLDPPKEFFEDVCSNAARRRSYHPVRDYLAGLTWDGAPRLDQWLPTYAGAADTPLSRAFGRKTLIAAVRRVRHPGCKFDQMLVLEGRQGAGKSSLVRVLAGDDWFTDSLTIGQCDKVIIEQTAGSWMVELAELAGIRRAEVEPIKTMISRQADRARLAYGKRQENVPRQFVFFGTVNDSAYLRDVSGNRRFWPVKVGAVDIEALRRDRDQLWAEAAHYEAQGEALELPSELWEQAAAEQEARLMSDPWEDILVPLLEDKRGHIPVALLWDTLQIKADRQDGNVGKRLNQLMGRLGFTRRRLRDDGRLVYGYSNEPQGGRWIRSL